MGIDSGMPCEASHLQHEQLVLKCSPLPPPQQIHASAIQKKKKHVEADASGEGHHDADQQEEDRNRHDPWPIHGGTLEIEGHSAWRCERCSFLAALAVRIWCTFKAGDSS